MWKKPKASEQHDPFRMIFWISWHASGEKSQLNIAEPYEKQGHLIYKMSAGKLYRPYTSYGIAYKTYFM